MYYLIIGRDREDSLEARMRVRAEHLARLQELDDNNRLLTAGPNPAIDSDNPGAEGFTGSTIIAKFDSLEDAKTWANNDPYILEGVYETVEIKPYKKVFPQ